MTEKDRVLQNITSFIGGGYSRKKRLEEDIIRLRSNLTELEVDNNRLKIQLDKCKETQKSAVASKQMVEEALNKAESRITTLVEQLKSSVQEEEYICMPVPISLSLLETFQILETLNSMHSVKHSLISMYLPPGYKVANIDRGFLQYFNEKDIQIMEKMNSSTGMVIFHDTNNLVFEVFLPALPLMKYHCIINEKFDVDGLIQILTGKSSVLVVIVHAGESFIGYTEDGEHLLASHIVRSSVKAKHTKGGFSQRRFERLRDEEIVHHVEKVRTEIIQTLEDVGQEPDYVLIGGEIPLAREALEDIILKNKIVEHSLNIHIGKNDPNSILLKSLACRRYKL